MNSETLTADSFATSAFCQSVSRVYQLIQSEIRRNLSPGVRILLDAIESDAVDNAADDIWADWLSRSLALGPRSVFPATIHGDLIEIHVAQITSHVLSDGFVANFKAATGRWPSHYLKEVRRKIERGGCAADVMNRHQDRWDSSAGPSLLRSLRNALSAIAP